MWKIRESVEFKTFRTIRFTFSNQKIADKAGRKIVNYMDEMGITLVTSEVNCLDYSEEALLELRVFTTFKMYMHLKEKLFDIKTELEPGA